MFTTHTHTHTHTHTRARGTNYTLTLMCFTEQEVAAYLHGGKVKTEKLTGAGEMPWEYWKLNLIARLLNIVKWVEMDHF